MAELGIENPTLVAHNWGGPIGLAAAMPSRAADRFALGSTCARPVNGDWHFKRQNLTMRMSISRFTRLSNPFARKG